MSWSNFGEWHIDHIVPCAQARDNDELLKLQHYTNLQPLWASDNFSKNDTLESSALDLRMSLLGR
jgi:hypothetical protein